MMTEVGPTRAPLRRSAAHVAGFTVAYLVAVWLGFQFIDPVTHIGSIWPANGVVLAALLLAPVGARVPLLVVIASLAAALIVGSGEPVPSTAGFALADVVEIALCYAIVTRLARRRIDFTRVGDPAALIAAAAIASGAAAVVGAWTASWHSGAPFGESYTRWWVSGLLGLLLPTSLLVSWLTPAAGPRIGNPRLAIEAVAFAVAWAAATWAAFDPRAPDVFLAQPYVLLAMLPWAAFRFGARAVTVAMLGLACFVLTPSIVPPRHPGLASTGGPTPMVALEAYLAIASASGLLLAASVAQTRAAETKAREERERLEFLSNNIPDGALYQVVRELDGRMRFVFVSRTVERQYGVTVDAALRDPSLIYGQAMPDDWHRIVEAEERSYRTGEPFDETLQVVAPNGDLRWKRVTSMPRRLPDGRTLWDGLATDITEQRRARDAARRNADHLSLALQSARMGTWEWIVAEQRLILSPEASELLGATADRPVENALDFLAITHPDDRPIVQSILDDTARGEREQWADVQRILCRDGSIRWVEGRGRLQRDVDGTILGAAGVIGDVTQQRLTEASLARANRALRTLTECTRSVARAQDEATLLDEVCRSITALGGYELAIVGFAEHDEACTVRIAAHAGPGAAFLDTARITWRNEGCGRGPTGRAIRTGVPAVCSSVRTDPDYEPWRAEALANGFQASASFPLADGPVPFGTLSVYASDADAFDATEVELMAELARDLGHGIEALRERASRQRAEKALAESEARLGLAMDSSPIGMAITDVSGRYLYVNPALCRMLGYTHDELVARRVQEVIHPDDLGEDLIRAETLLTGKATTYDIEKRYLRSDGTSLWAQVSRTLVHGLDGDPPYLLAQVQDITERIHAAEALLKSNARLRLAMDIAKLGYWELDVDSGLFELDDDFFRLFHTTSEREGGHSMPAEEYARRFLPPEAAPLVSVEIRAALETTDPSYHRRIEHPIRRVDGTTGIVEVEIRVVKDGSGRTIRAFGANQDITERRRAEQALRESEERLRSAMESSPIGMTLVALDGRLLEVNPALCRILGYARDELLVRRFQDITHPEDLDADLAQVSRLLAGEADSYQMTKRYVRADGQTIRAQLNVSLVRDGERRPVHFLSQVQDITERVRAEDEIRESNAKLRLAMDIAKLGYWEYDLANDRFTVDDGILRILRTSVESEGRRDFSPCEYAQRFMPPEVGHVVQEGIQAVSDWPSAEYEQVIEHPIVRADGTRGMVQVQVRAQKDPSGRVIRAYGCNQDITERSEAAQALSASETRFRQVVDQIKEVFWMADAAFTQVLYVSPAYEKIWGRSCASAYADPASVVLAIHAEDRVRALGAVRSARTRGFFDEEYRVVRPDGTERWVHGHATLVRDSSGQAAQLVGVAQDITERRHFEEQFLQAQKLEAIGRLAGGVAHDFNNILAAMMLLAEDVATDAESSESIRERMTDMTRALDRAAALTRQLLAFSRRQVMRPRPIDVNDVINDLAKMLRRILGEDIRLRLDLHPGGMVVEADTGMLEQVLMNLAVNARDAMPAGGSLAVETAREVLDENAALAIPEGVAGTYARIRMVDTGCGIPAENMEHIFEPFFTTKELGKGTGLGLATVFGIVRQHHGLVRVSSVVDRGTTFDVLLPIAADADTADAGEPALVIAPNPRGTETVLLVEDDPAVRRVTCLALERHGYSVIEAESGPAALDKLAEHGSHVDLLLTDVVMPEGMTGIELADQVARYAPHVKVILTSGYSADLAQRASEHRFLQKPCRPRDLLLAVREVLDGR